MMTATCLSSKKRQRRASAQPFSKAFFSTRPDFGNSKGGPSIRSLAGQLRPQGDSTRLDSGLAPHPRHVGMAHADRRCSGCGTPHNFRARPHVSPRLLIFAQPSRLSRIHAAHSRWIAGDNEFSRSGPRSTSLGRAESAPAGSWMSPYHPNKILQRQSVKNGLGLIAFTTTTRQHSLNQKAQRILSIEITFWAVERCCSLAAGR